MVSRLVCFWSQDRSSLPVAPYNSTIRIRSHCMGSDLISNVRLKPEPYTVRITNKSGEYNCHHMELLNTIRASSIPYYSQVNSYSITGGYYDDGMYFYLNGTQYDRATGKVSGDLMAGSISLRYSDVMTFYMDDSGGVACTCNPSRITFDYAWSD